MTTQRPAALEIQRDYIQAVNEHLRVTSSSISAVFSRAIPPSLIRQTEEKRMIRLFSPDFASQICCFFWHPGIVWLYAISDAVMVLACSLILGLLVYFVLKRRALPFHWTFLWCGLCIFGYGTVHLVGVWTIWNGTPAGIIKTVMALAALTAAAFLIPHVPGRTQLELASRWAVQRDEGGKPVAD